MSLTTKLTRLQTFLKGGAGKDFPIMLCCRDTFTEIVIKTKWGCKEQKKKKVTHPLEYLIAKKQLW